MISIPQGKALYVLGLQYGDEGKGKLVDELSPQFDAVARCGGGANAGHTIWNAGRKFVTHLLPSGVLHPQLLNVIGTGVVVDPVELTQELLFFAQKGENITPNRLLIDARATVVLKSFKTLDRQKEAERMQANGVTLGTTGKGIGPAHASRSQREAKRFIDFVQLKDIAELKNFLPAEEYSEQEFSQLWDSISYLKPYLGDASKRLNQLLQKGGRVLLEGAQGAMLDLYYGTYPFVSSGQCHPGAACAGLGISPRYLAHTLGVAKAYATRVGEGHFAGEIFGDLAERLREKGHEYGATTGRPRRVGWLDAVSLQYVCQTFGVDSIALMKADVLNDETEIKMVQEYEPEPLYAFAKGHTSVALSEPLKPWNAVLQNQSSNQANLNPDFSAFVQRLEKQVRCDVSYVSYGPERGQGVWR